MTVYPCYLHAWQPSNGEGFGATCPTPFSSISVLPPQYQVTPPGTMIWNHTNGVAEQLVHTLPTGPRNNSSLVGSQFTGNTWVGVPNGLNAPEDGPVIGPEMSLYPLLRNLHPQYNKVFFLKLGQGFSTLANSPGSVPPNDWKKSTGELYTEMQNRYTAFKAGVIAQYPGDVTGLDIRGVFMVNGEPDALSSGNPVAYLGYEVNLTEVINFIRADYPDTTCAPIPVVYAMMHAECPLDEVVAGDYTTQIATVRAAQLAVAKALPRVATFDPSEFIELDYEDFIENVVNNPGHGFTIHYKAQDGIRLGEEMFSAFEGMFPKGSAVVA